MGKIKKKLNERENKKKRREWKALKKGEMGERESAKVEGMRKRRWKGKDERNFKKTKKSATAV